MALTRIPSRHLDLGPAQIFEPFSEVPAGNQIKVREGWVKIGASAIQKAEQTTVAFVSVTGPNLVRWDLVYIDTSGNVQVIAGTEVADISPEFTNAPSPPAYSFPVAYVKVTESGAVVVDTTDITDIRPNFNILENTAYANNYAIDDTDDYNTTLSKLSEEAERVKTWLGKTNRAESLPDFSGFSPLVYINVNDDARDAIGKHENAIQAISPIGGVLAFVFDTPPSGWLECDGSSLLISSYTNLFLVAKGYYGPGAISRGCIFNPSPTDTVQDLVPPITLNNGDIVHFTSGAALPPSVVANTPYYVINVNQPAGTFQISLTQGGPAVLIPVAGTPPHFYHTTFNIPDLRGEFVRGWDNSRGVDPDAGTRTDRGDGTTGDNVGTKQDDIFEDHQHTLSSGTFSAGGVLAAVTGAGGSSTGFGLNPLGGAETRPRNVALMYCIKY